MENSQPSHQTAAPWSSRIGFSNWVPGNSRCQEKMGLCETKVFVFLKKGLLVHSQFSVTRASLLVHGYQEYSLF